jgi:hypothetical protein
MGVRYRRANGGQPPYPGQDNHLFPSYPYASRRAMVSKMADWKAQQGRVTLFPGIPTGSSPPSAVELFKRVWAADPDTFQKHGVGTTPFAPSVAQGNRDGLLVSCSVQPARIDFFVMPQTSTDTALSLIADTNRFRDELLLIIQSAKDTPGSYNRVACFAQFASVTNSYREANELICSVLPKQFTLDISGAEDLSLQINRPRVEGDLKINYLTRWASERAQYFVLGAGPAQILAENFIGVMQFDNNNYGTGLLSKDQISLVLRSALDGISDGLREMRVKIKGF